MDDTQAPHLEMGILSGGLDVVTRPDPPPLEATIERLKAELWRQGIIARGPALLGWNTFAERELRQPILARFALPLEAAYTTAIRDDRLVVQLAIPARDGLYNLAGIYDLIAAYALEPIGAPLVVLDPQQRTALAGSATAYVPVLPQGTRILVPRQGWFQRKIGFQPPPIDLGGALSPSLAWAGAWRLALRLWIGLAAISLLVLPSLALGLVAAGLGDVAWWLGGLWLGAMTAGVGAITLAGWLAYRRAIRRWNMFWSQHPDPPRIVLDESEDLL